MFVRDSRPHGQAAGDAPQAFGDTPRGTGLTSIKAPIKKKVGVADVSGYKGKTGVKSNILSAVLGRWVGKIAQGYFSQDTKILIVLAFFGVIILLIGVKAISWCLKKASQSKQYKYQYAACRKELALNPHNASSNFTMGLLSQTVKQHAEAIKYFQQAICYHKNETWLEEAHLRLGKSYLALGENDLAFAEYKMIQTDQHMSKNLLDDILKTSSPA